MVARTCLSRHVGVQFPLLSPFASRRRLRTSLFQVVDSTSFVSRSVDGAAAAAAAGQPRRAALAALAPAGRVAREAADGQHSREAHLHARQGPHGQEAVHLHALRRRVRHFHTFFHACPFSRIKLMFACSAKRICSFLHLFVVLRFFVKNSTTIK